MASPEIVLGSSLLALFVNAGFAGQLGFWTIFVAHVMFCLSFVVITVKARLSGLDPRLEEAAGDLYANEWQTFWRVTFPLVMPGIVSAALLSFSLSFDDFIITNLNSGQTVTFPMYVWGAAQRGVPMQVNVIGTIMFLLALGLVLGSTVVRRIRERPVRLTPGAETRRLAGPTNLGGVRGPGRDPPHLFVHPGEAASDGRVPTSGRHSMSQASVSTLRRICSISSKCAWSQISGGASWTTGSPRSSARQ